MELNGMTALVTGGADGIGAGIAERLATEGMHVIIADRDEKAGPVMAERIGGSFFRTDLGRRHPGRADHAVPPRRRATPAAPGD